MKYRIKPKRDFGDKAFWIDRTWVRRGYVVTRDGCNAMPGAVWFRTIADAMNAIECLERFGYDQFWQNIGNFTRRHHTGTTTEEKPNGP